MTLLSSLRGRMFLASAVLAVVCIGIAIFIVNGQVTREAERTIEREIVATSGQVEQLRNERAQTFTLMARLIADLPKLKAAMATDDPPTVKDIASGYQAQLKAKVMLVTNKDGQVLYEAGGSPRIGIVASHQPAVREALDGHETISLLPQPHGAIHAGLLLTAVFAVIVATALSFAVARTIARPLAAITGVMREVSATGDLTRKIALREGSRWDDDDARLLATTFNTLTDSI